MPTQSREQPVTIHTVLIVDDHPPSLKLTELVLKAAGVHVLSADTAVSALNMLRAEPVDLLITGIGLPDMNGLTMVRLLREDPRNQGTKVLILTAAAMKGDEEKAHAAGADAYFTKPLHARALVKVVMNLLHRTA